MCYSCLKRLLKTINLPVNFDLSCKSKYKILTMSFIQFNNDTITFLLPLDLHPYSNQGLPCLDKTLLTHLHPDAVIPFHSAQN